jgi:hypothetical protein
LKLRSGSLAIFCRMVTIFLRLLSFVFCIFRARGLSTLSYMVCPKRECVDKSSSIADVAEGFTFFACSLVATSLFQYLSIHLRFLGCVNLLYSSGCRRCIDRVYPRCNVFRAHSRGNEVFVFDASCIFRNGVIGVSPEWRER